jgi:Mlc titration factor MtfA (ptsG expression regulator)
MFAFFRNHRRRALAAEPFPPEWEPIVERRFPALAGLERFRVHLKVFAWDKDWVGVKGLEVTDEMKVVISGAAARLARNLDLDVYDELRTIVIYPSHFRKAGEEEEVFLGQAFRWGQVVLSWDAVIHGLANPTDGRDTALHEFAHMLDAHGGVFDGTPQLHDSRDYSAWATVFSRHFFKLRERPEGNVLRAYGATNEAEFFAVATETFFEKPERLKRAAPDLYELLAKYYQLDPATAVTQDRH